METLPAHQLSSRHLGEKITARPISPHDGEPLETTVQGELLAVDPLVGQMVLTIGRGDGSEPVEVMVKALDMVRIDLY